ncbi:unnamed protein product [Caenorhabditis sp. 36 PRJEB53466]|nr:unnamed protein product [Caenorhabditis sp. 36 PRJEB53466]
MTEAVPSKEEIEVFDAGDIDAALMNIYEGFEALIKFVRSLEDLDGAWRRLRQDNQEEEVVYNYYIKKYTKKSGTNMDFVAFKDSME